MPSPVFHYKLFDFVVSAGIPLPELPLAEEDSPFLHIRLVSKRPEWVDRSDWDWHWRMPDGEIFLSVAREGGRILLQFPRVLDVEYRSDDGSIELCSAEESLDATVRHLVLDHVLPRLVSHQGRLVLHAAAVADPDGVILLLGPTGAGKSTLAASFRQDGVGVLTDDCVLLQPTKAGFSALPAYPGLRLWPDSEAGLDPEGMAGSESTRGTWKNRQDIDSIADGTRAVRAILILESPDEAADGGRISVEPVHGPHALIELLQHCFMLDPGDRDTLEKQFLSAADLAGSLPLFRLSYPRDFSRLTEVRERIGSALRIS